MTETKKVTKKRAKVSSITTGTKKADKAKDNKYAVFAVGGKQYLVQLGDKIKIEKIIGEYSVGDTISFDYVLMVKDGATNMTLGKPFIENAKVTAVLTKMSRYKTIDVIKYKQKSRYFKKYGHRQPYFEVEITGIK